MLNVITQNKILLKTSGTNCTCRYTAHTNKLINFKITKKKNVIIDNF